MNVMIQREAGGEELGFKFIPIDGDFVVFDSDKFIDISNMTPLKKEKKKE